MWINDHFLSNKFALFNKICTLPHQSVSLQLFFSFLSTFPFIFIYLFPSSHFLFLFLKYLISALSTFDFYALAPGEHMNKFQFEKAQLCFYGKWKRTKPLFNNLKRSSGLFDGCFMFHFSEE